MNRLFLLFISCITIGTGAHAMEHLSLTDAAKAGDLEAVKRCIAKGEDVDQTDVIGIYGITGLMYAALHGHLLVVECLIEAGADIHNPNGDTALMDAALRGHSLCCQALVHAILRPSPEQKNRIYEFLLCISKNENETIAAAYTLCILDIFKIHLQALIKEENKPKAIAEIEKIDNQEIKNQLLALCQ